MSKKEIGAFLSTCLSAVGTGVQTNKVFEIISLVITIIGGILTIIITISNWYSKAKADGKITKDEITEIIDAVKDETNHVIDEIHKNDKKGEDENDKDSK